MSEALLEVKDLHVHYLTDDGVCKALNGVSFNVEKGETLGLVGETGAGKTTAALSILRLIPDPPGKIISGDVIYGGKSVLDMNKKELRDFRGKHVSMIFQDPMNALNPVDRIGDQIAEIFEIHRNMSHGEAELEATKVLEMVGIDPRRYKEYPHQFSGGMKQRVVIAIALACNPELLIADEPTTALDVTIQAQILDLINDLKQKLGTAVILITHDLGVVAQMCDKVAVMYAGEIVESGNLTHLFDEYKHPYTVGLFGSLPDVAGDAKRLTPIDGMMPDPMMLPTGCKFADRCPKATAKCHEQLPDLRELTPGHMVRCFAAFEEEG